MNHYTDLVAAKDELRRAKDHEQTMRAIAEYGTLGSKNESDRKRELAFVLSQDDGWRKAIADLRNCELAVDRAQARIDQAESERREKELAIRRVEADIAREANNLKGIEIGERAYRVRHERDLHDPVNQAQAQREMDELSGK